MRPCAVCGREKVEHHEYNPSMPPGCVCEPGEWDDEVPSPCDEYCASDIGNHCLTCEHDKECHLGQST